MRQTTPNDVRCADGIVRRFHEASALNRHRGYVYATDEGGVTHRIYGHRLWIGDEYRFAHGLAGKWRHLVYARIPASA